MAISTHFHNHVIWKINSLECEGVVVDDVLDPVYQHYWEVRLATWFTSVASVPFHIRVGYQGVGGGMLFYNRASLKQLIGQSDFMLLFFSTTWELLSARSQAVFMKLSEKVGITAAKQIVASETFTMRYLFGASGVFVPLLEPAMTQANAAIRTNKFPMPHPDMPPIDIPLE